MDTHDLPDSHSLTLDPSGAMLCFPGAEGSTSLDVAGLRAWARFLGAAADALETLTGWDADDVKMAAPDERFGATDQGRFELNPYLVQAAYRRRANPLQNAAEVQD